MIAIPAETAQRQRRRRTVLQRRATKRRLLGLRPKPCYRWWLLVFFSVLLVVVATVAALAFAASTAYTQLLASLPSPEGVIEREVFKTTTIYDRNGEVLYQLWDPRAGKRTMVHLDDLPATVISATIATEDANFYQNPGFDVRSIARAAWQNLRGQSIVSGASTITQQLVRNTVFDPTERFEQSYIRKLREAMLAYQLSQRYSKDQILEMYLNEVYYGSLAYGIEAAAQSYFGKPAEELTLAEAALLAGLPQAPADYDPTRSPQRAKARQREVLGLMVRHGFLDAVEAEAAAAEPLRFSEPHYDIKAPHFALYVRDLIEQRYGERQLYYGGLKVYTTLDSGLQAVAERTARQHIATIAKENANNAAVVAIAPQTGEVLVMLGSVDFYKPEIDGEVNMAVAERQPGSTLKPFTYLLAFERGLAPASVVVDREVAFPDGEGRPPYKPRNHDGKFRGPVTLRQALANSLNIPAVLMLEYVGVPSLLDVLHKAGITSLNDRGRYGLALTLGGGEVPLLDLTFAYATLANGGRQIGRPIPPAELLSGQRRHEPALVLRVEDAEGNVLEDYQAPPGEQILSPQLTYLITDILSDDNARVATYGPHSSLELSRPAAAKTGTTDDYRDAWTIGYTPDLVTGVWVGNADNAPMNNVFGSAGAGRIWHDFMEEALRDRPASPFTRPDGLVRAAVSAATGLRPAPGEKTTTDWFVESAVPQQWSEPPAAPAPTPAPMPAPTIAGRATPTATPTTEPSMAIVRGIVPAVVGLSEQQARLQIEAAGFNNTYANYQGPGDVPESALRSVPPGHVLSQMPAPGTVLPPGSSVHMAVRKQ